MEYDRWMGGEGRVHRIAFAILHRHVIDQHHATQEELPLQRRPAGLPCIWPSAGRRGGKRDGSLQRSRMEEKPKAIAVGVAVAIDRSLTVSITLCHGIGNGKKIQATHAAEGSSEIPICPVCKQ